MINNITRLKVGESIEGRLLRPTYRAIDARLVKCLNIMTSNGKVTIVYSPAIQFVMPKCKLNLLCKIERVNNSIYSQYNVYIDKDAT